MTVHIWIQPAWAHDVQLNFVGILGADMSGAELPNLPSERLRQGSMLSVRPFSREPPQQLNMEGDTFFPLWMTFLSSFLAFVTWFCRFVTLPLCLDLPCINECNEALFLLRCPPWPCDSTTPGGLRRPLARLDAGLGDNFSPLSDCVAWRMARMGSSLLKLHSFRI